MKIVKRVNVLRIDDTKQKIEDVVINDIEIELTLNSTILGIFTVIPTKIMEFAIGYLLSEGFIKNHDEIEDINIKKERVDVKVSSKQFKVASECIGSGWRLKVESLRKIESKHYVDKEVLCEAFNVLREDAKLWRKTGGTHVAGLILDAGEKITTIEDVSRHTAVDKIIGYGAISKINFSESVLICSCRIPAAMITKAARVGIPIVASKAAPTYSGVIAAKKLGITLVGFVRENRLNIYTYPERIKGS